MIGTKKLELPVFGKPYEKQDVVEEKTQLKLFGNFYLPIYLGHDLVREYVSEERVYTKDEVKELFEDKIQKFIESLQEKGVQIIEKNVTIDKNAGVWKMKVDFLALEKTGITRKTQTAPLDESAEEENQE